MGWIKYYYGDDCSVLRKKVIVLFLVGNALSVVELINCKLLSLQADAGRGEWWRVGRKQRTPGGNEGRKTKQGKSK